MVSQMSRYSKFPLIAVAFSIGAVFSPSRHVLWAQADKPAIAPQPRTLTRNHPPSHERVYQRDLKPDLIPTQRRSAG